MSLSLAALLVSCAQRHFTLPPTASVPSPAPGFTASTTISITIPQGKQTSGAWRRAAYISTATNSMVLTPQGQTPIVIPLTTTTPGCRVLSGSRICTISVSLPVGSYTIGVALYASADGTGTPLAMVSTTQTIVQNATNNLDFTLNAVVWALAVSLSPDGVFSPGTAATRTIMVSASDSAGATIVIGSDALVAPSGAPLTIQLSDTDTSGSTAVTPTIVGASPSILSYNGGTPNGTDVIATAKTASNLTLTTAQASFTVGTASCGAGSSASWRVSRSAPMCTPPSHFLSSPLDFPQGVYTPHIMYSILDHQMKLNCGGLPTCNPTTHLYAYGAGDGVIVAFNGERADQPAQSNDPTCIGGTIHLATIPNDHTSDLVINPPPPPAPQPSLACHAGFASYDEHPGYDYLATMHTPVFPAGTGIVVDNGDPSVSLASRRCVRTFSAKATSCEDWGVVGIDHGNGYITQYGHLDNSYVFVYPGEVIDPAFLARHDPIALSGATADPPHTVGPHLHFEVLGHIARYSDLSADYNPLHWAVVDPYGWTGGVLNPDPLYSTGLGLTPAQLWR